MLARFRSGTTRLQLLLAALFLACLLIVPSSASGYNGIPNDLTGYRWNGQIGTSYNIAYSFAPTSRYEAEGSFTLDNLALKSSSGGEQIYTSDVAGSTVERRYSCDPLRLKTTLTFSNDGTFAFPWDPGVLQETLNIDSRPDGFYMVPRLLYGNHENSTSNQDCSGQPTAPSDPIELTSFNGFSLGQSGYERLLADTDPNPFHLVGTSTWTEANLPSSASHPFLTFYSYSLSYDLTLVPDGTECADGIDNDGDGRTDFPSDPGCTDASDVSELGSAECDNGIDDDGNGTVDFRSNGQGDPNCQSLTDEREAHPDSCIDRFYTVADGKSSLRLTVLPDPDIGSASLGVAWCTTENGAAIQSVPGQYLFLTDKWIFLGALESSGFKPVARSLKISQIKSSVSATGQVGLKFSLGEVAASLFPYGRALKAIDKATKKLKKLNRAGKLSAQAVQNFRQLVRHLMDELEDKLEKGLAKKLDRIPLVPSGTAKQFADGITDVLEEVTSHFEKKLFASIPSRASGPIFKQLFKDVTVPLWKPNISLSFSNNGSYQFRDGSSVMIPGMIKNEWKHGHK